MDKFSWILPGIAKCTFGNPEAVTPCRVFAQRVLTENFLSLPECRKLPFRAEEITFSVSARGCRIELPCGEDEDFYGFGLQLKSLACTGRKRALRVNSDPREDLGDSHAPAPLFFSTRGYGVMIDTARYMNAYMGGNLPLAGKSAKTAEEKTLPSDEAEKLYARDAIHAPLFMDIPVAQGVDIYIFCGNNLKEALRRYVLFCGGGCNIPLWGLGLHYRIYTKADEKIALKTAETLRQNQIPCDVLGLEPGWQTHAYSCSLKWSNERFPHWQEMIAELHKQGFHVNLWEHLFLDEGCPIYDSMKEYAGEFQVFDGIVPDLFIPEAQEIFKNYHVDNLIRKGVDAFKLDECDNSDYQFTSWSFPEFSRFPSGIDGEQMHSMLGIKYQQTIVQSMKKAGVVTCGNVRNSHLFAPPLPFVLYSDLYDHVDFIRGICSCGFGGMLWTPELRHAASENDYRRRLQTLILSPQFLMNIWAMPHPPWKQLNEELNRQGVFHLPEKEDELLALTRECVNMRMSFVPYLFMAFGRYQQEGTPPFRALVTEDPENPELRKFDRAWFAGEDLIAAPLVDGEKDLTIPLPSGRWYDFYTGQIYEKEVIFGGDYQELPILVRENSIIPLAHPRQYLDNGRNFEFVINVYGSNPRPFEFFNGQIFSESLPENKTAVGLETLINGKCLRVSEVKYF